MVAAAESRKQPTDGQRAEEQQKANERATRKMLRKKDAAFAELEAKGMIETVQIAPNGECEGYMVRAEKPAREKQAEQMILERGPGASKTKRVSSEAAQGSERGQEEKKTRSESAGRGRLETVGAGAGQVSAGVAKSDCGGREAELDERGGR